MATKGAFSKFNKKNIKFGTRFRSGKGVYSSRFGLSGALRELKDPKYGGIAKNLSKKDLEAFSKVISPKLKSKYRFSNGLNRLDRYKIRLELQKLWRKGEISKPDLRDFYNIIDKLSDM